MGGFAGIEDIEEFEKTPLEDRLKLKTTWEIFEEGEKNFGDSPALDYLFFGRADEKPYRFTYKEMASEIRRAANMFHSLGVCEEHPVSLLLPNLPETLFSLWAGELAGVVNPINLLLEPEHIASIIREAGSKVLVTLPPFPKTDCFEKLTQIARDVPELETVLLVDMSRYLPFIKRHLVRFMFRPEPIEGLNILSYHDELARHHGDSLEFEREIGPDTVASLFHTGGTTGTPKLAEHTHFNEVFDAWVLGEVATIDKESSGLCALPLFHVNACIVTGLAPFIRGSRVLLLTPAGYRSPDVFPNFWKLLEKYKISFFSAVPTVFSTLLNYPMHGENLSSLQFAITGAAPMPPEVFKKFQDKTGLRIIEGYGQTEGTCASSCNPLLGESRIGSIGVRFPYQPMKVAKLDEEGNFLQDCKTNEVGHVFIKGPNIFPGYTDESKNEGVFFDGGWINTGDLGRMDKEGYFWLTGRAKDLIIRGGHNIDPAMIESAITELEGIDMVAAVGQPDAHAGEVPVAFVTLKGGARLSEENIREFAKTKVPERAAIPVRVQIVDQIPLTPVGKIFKPDLRHKAIQYVYQKALEESEISALIEVKAHETQGTLARVKIQNGEIEKAKEILGAFTIPVEFH